MIREIELSIVAPMYNEEENVSNTVQSIENTMLDFPHPWELVLVNDGSIDNTLSLAQEWAERRSFLRVISYPLNQGRGKALRTGFNSAKGKYVISIDFDLSYTPDHILRIYNELAENPLLDIVLASAYMPGGEVIGNKSLHLMLSRIGNRILGIAFKGKFKTTTCVLRGYRGAALRGMVLESNQKEIHLEILSKAVALNYRIKEIPATLRTRQHGMSKTNLRSNSISHLIFSVYESPFLMFGIVGMIMLLFGGLIAIDLTYLWLVGQLTPGRPLFYVMMLSIIAGIQFFSFGLISGQNSMLRNELYKLQSQVKLLEDNSRDNEGARSE